MTEQTMLASVRRTITVETSRERAFALFTERAGSWWPATHHIAPQPFVAVVMEPRVGGRWFERSAEGAECEWGHVLAWEPPSRVVLAWQLTAEWKYEPDMAKASEVEVRFVAEGAKRTRVELEHRGFERHGAGAEKMRTAVEGPSGWTQCLTQFNEATQRA